MKFEYRIVNKFLWLPKTINDKKKWLCFALWEESREKRLPESSILNPFGIGTPYWTDWKPIKFLD